LAAPVADWNITTWIECSIGEDHSKGSFLDRVGIAVQAMLARSLSRYDEDFIGAS
jgi:hypothetical protein